MPYYTLLIVDQHKHLHTPARDRPDALAIFGEELKAKLALEARDKGAAPYLLDEWEGGAHWINPTIPVFVAD
jgi:hypothetical protein